MKKTLIFAALIAAASGAAIADPRDEALSAMLRCSGLSDRNARLGCYDATIARAPNAMNGAMNAAPAPRAAAPAPAATAAYVPPPATPVPQRQRRESFIDNVLGTGGPSRPPQTSVAQFGSESIANGGTHAYPTARENDTIDQISARVIAYNFDAGFVTVTLDNGQVWRQPPGAAPLGHLSKPALSYTARIDRDGPYGSYGLRLSGVGKVIGVRRIR